MKLWLILPMLVLLIGARAMAEPIAALGTNLVFESDADGHSTDTRQPISLRGGYRFQPLDTYLEYTNFRTSSGTTMVFVSREHQEWLLWGRKLLNPNWTVTPYGAAALGFQSDRVETDFARETSKESGDPQPMAALAAGIRIRVFDPLDLQIEGRASYAADNDPNPMFGLGIVAGWAF